MQIRQATLNDAGAIAAIYNYYILHTAITFEIEPIDTAEMKRRMTDVFESGNLFYIGEVDGRVVGYYYTHLWNTRRAYDSTIEDSIYLDKDEAGKGYGTLLLEHLLAGIDRRRIHVVIAGITLPNAGSVKLHEKFGFKQISCMKEVGRKFDQWQDVGHWQLILDTASSAQSMR